MLTHIIVFKLALTKRIRRDQLSLALNICQSESECEKKKMIEIGGKTYRKTGNLDQQAEIERKNLVKSMSKPLSKARYSFSQ